MSLLKAYMNTKTVRPRSEVVVDFKTMIEACVLSDIITKEDVATAIAFYAEYSLAYLTEVSQTLEDPVGAGSAMKFMNSYIAEFTNKAGLHYFDLDKGYSVVDKAVQLALDVGGFPPVVDVVAIIDAIEESYVEVLPEDFEELEENLDY